MASTIRAGNTTPRATCATGGRRLPPKAFSERAKAVVDQYSAYEPLPGLHINGKLTQGENIADIGGLKIAYAAFKKAQAAHHDDPNKKIDGFTPDQRFFLAWAQIWRANQRDQETEAASQHRSAFAGPFPHHRPRLQHAGIPKSLRPARQQPDGPSRKGTRQHLVGAAGPPPVIG